MTNIHSKYHNEEITLDDEADMMPPQVLQQPNAIPNVDDIQVAAAAALGHLPGDSDYEESSQASSSSSESSESDYESTDELGARQNTDNDVVQTLVSLNLCFDEHGTCMRGLDVYVFNSNVSKCCEWV